MLLLILLLSVLMMRMMIMMVTLRMMIMMIMMIMTMLFSFRLRELAHDDAGVLGASEFPERPWRSVHGVRGGWQPLQQRSPGKKPKSVRPEPVCWCFWCQVFSNVAPQLVVTWYQFFFSGFEFAPQYILGLAALMYGAAKAALIFLAVVMVKCCCWCCCCL